jgi:23S rRNA pseudouridine1911/1915/1917 synthase
MPPQTLELTVRAGQTDRSLEALLAEVLELPHLTVRAWIQAGHIRLNQQRTRPGRRPRCGEQISIVPPPLRPHPAQAQALDLPIYYQDQTLIVVNKPAGMATHPGPGWWQGSCVNALLHAISDWPGVGGVAGPGIVHRLDRDTSGLLLFARNDAGHRALLAALQARQIERRYLAWVEGELSGEGLIDQPLGRDPRNPQQVIVTAAGKPARTHYRALAQHRGRSLLELTLETGRTHQIRVHLAWSGHPVCGDPRYGQADAQMYLHAWHLRLRHPDSRQPLAFCCLPDWPNTSAYVPIVQA